jgi:hypothetical protein
VIRSGLPRGPGKQRQEGRKHRIDAAAHEPRDATHAPVDEPGESPRRLVRRSPQDTRSSRDVVVHRLDDLGHQHREIDDEAAHAAQVGKR